MGLVNDAMCGYLTRPDVFADCWNGLCFDGEPVLEASKLQTIGETYYRIKEDGKKSEKRQRDLIMKVSEQSAYAILAIENQSEIDYRMPVRRMEYDAMEYQRQIKEIVAANRKEEQKRKGSGLPSMWRHSGEFLSGFCKEDRILPVATLVVYHGTEPYDGCLDLHSMLEWNRENERIKPWVPNYSLQVVTLREVDEEKFQTGLREVIGLLKRSGDKVALHQYCQENEERLRELDEETVNTIGAVIDYPALNRYRNEKGDMEMCRALEDLKREGYENGIREGIKTLIERLNKYGIERTLIRESIMEDYDLTVEKAEEYMKQYWID